MKRGRELIVIDIYFSGEMMFKSKNTFCELGTYFILNRSNKRFLTGELKIRKLFTLIIRNLNLNVTAIHGYNIHESSL